MDIVNIHHRKTLLKALAFSLKTLLISNGPQIRVAISINNMSTNHESHQADSHPIGKYDPQVKTSGPFAIP